MKRQIKFRAFVEKDNVMISHREVIERAHLQFEGQLNHNDIVMQFTGLQDKNGKDIYEGDILRFLDGINKSCENGFDWEEDYSIGKVYWCAERNGWQVSNQVMTDEDSVWEDIEIIGNIYENPELLKTTENE